MNQELALETYAVVVGIEQYQMGSNLSRDGIAKNALDFTDWLLTCGVPSDNISLFISELEKDEQKGGNEKLITEYKQEKKIEIKKATKDNITKTIFDEIPTKQGKLFYFYWIGHGYITNVTQRQLLYADTTENTSAFNLSSFIESLKTDTFPNFDEQILFVDACAVYAYQKSKKIYIGENLAHEEYKIGKPKSRQQFSFLASQEGDTAKFDEQEKTAIFSKVLLKILLEKSGLLIPQEMKELQLAEKIQSIFKQDYSDYSEPIYFWFDAIGNVENFVFNPSIPPVHQLGPYFVTKSKAEYDKDNPKIVDSFYSEDCALPNPESRIKYIQLIIIGGLWSRIDEKATIKAMLSNEENDKNFPPIYISRQIPQNNAQNYRDHELMEIQRKLIKWDSVKAPSKFTIKISPGSYAVSIGSIELYYIKVNILGGFEMKEKCPVITEDHFFITKASEGEEKDKNPIYVPEEGKYVYEKAMHCDAQKISYEFLGAHYALDHGGAGLIQIEIWSEGNNKIGEKSIIIKKQMSDYRHIYDDSKKQKYSGEIEWEKSPISKVRIFARAGYWAVIISNLKLSFE